MRSSRAPRLVSCKGCSTERERKRVCRAGNDRRIHSERKNERKELVDKSWQSPVKAIDQCGFHGEWPKRFTVKRATARFQAARGRQRARAARAHLRCHLCPLHSSRACIPCITDSPKNHARRGVMTIERTVRWLACDTGISRLAKRRSRFVIFGGNTPNRPCSTGTLGGEGRRPAERSVRPVLAELPGRSVPDSGRDWLKAASVLFRQ